jgi:nucleotide-binding universal stress UspA family protein
MDKNAQEKAQEWLTNIHRERLGNTPNCETLVARGELLEHVLHAVREHHIDVVALSAHTHPGFHIHLISSLPEKLVRQAPCHVLVIHNAG